MIGWGSLVKGSLRMPRENDSALLLDQHKRGLQNLNRMRRYSQSEAVDLVVVGAGAGGTTLAQRLARAGWRIVILEKGPFWDPDRDWVSDEKGSAKIYWIDVVRRLPLRLPREDPQELVSVVKGRRCAAGDLVDHTAKFRRTDRFPVRPVDPDHIRLHRRNDPARFFQPA